MRISGMGEALTCSTAGKFEISRCRAVIQGASGAVNIEIQYKALLGEISTLTAR
jgi:hypothetical protein